MNWYLEQSVLFQFHQKTVCWSLSLTPPHGGINLIEKIRFVYTHTQTFLPASHATCAHTNTRTHVADAWLRWWITWDNLSWSQSSAPKTHLAPTGEPELSATKSTKWTSSEATLERPTYTWHNVMWCNPVKYSVRNRRQLKILSSLSHETYSQQSSFFFRRLPKFSFSHDDAEK